MLRIARLPAAVLDDPNLMISADAVAWLLEESARLSGQEAFGLLMADMKSLANLGMLALALREEPTLRAATESSVRYMRLHNAGVQLRLEDESDFVLVHVDVNVKHEGVRRQAIEQAMVVVLRVLRVLSADTFWPQRFCFTHDRAASLEVHRRVLGRASDWRARRQPGPSRISEKAGSRASEVCLRHPEPGTLVA
nr:AraC family transcriptional regulator ligand-binding domain-containing protein [Variovorax sp. dw_308]